MRIIFTIQFLLLGFSLTAMMAPETLAHHAQRILDREISIDVQNAPLAAALAEIEVAADVKFAYSASQLDVSQAVTMVARRKKLGLVLNDLLGPIAIMYTVDRDYILLKPVKAEIEKALPVEKQPEPVLLFESISGTVTDAATLQPVAGVNIIVKGTTAGTTTDAEGRYVIDAEDGDVLVFTFIGYKKVEVPVSGNTVIDVVLEEDVASLKEVVVNAGYYLTTDRTKTGNISRVTAEEIGKQPVTSPLMALQGRVAGLEITIPNGVPGNAPKIRIRGENSLRYDGGYPLYIIDGVPIDSRPLTSSSSSLVTALDPLGTINPANIESIEVLKDADATSIYGSRGANGVILITTKGARDRSGKTRVDVGIYKGAGKVANTLDLMNTPQYLQMRNEAYKNDGVTPQVLGAPDLVLWDTTRYTDWQALLIGGTADITDIQASVSGGNSNTFFRFGTGYHKETLVFPGDFYYQRASVSLNLNHSAPDQKFRTTLSVNYGADKDKVFDDLNLVNYALTLPPNAPRLYDDDGNLNWEANASGTSTWTNPMSLMRKTHDTGTRSLIANSMVSYAVAPRLVFKVNLGFNDLASNELLKIPFSSMSPEDLKSRTAENTIGQNRRQSWLIEPQVSYVHHFSKHQIDAVTGMTWQESMLEYQSTNATGYTSDAFLGALQWATTTRVLAEGERQYKYNAVFARIGYSYDQKYILNLTGRRDGSSRFGPGNKFGDFGAVGAAWIFSNENFMKGLGFLSFGKLRASFGTTGNDQIGDYQFYDLYVKTSFNYDNAIGIVPSSLYNPDFHWELTEKTEAGIAFGILDNRITVEGNFYRNRSSNQLIGYRLPATTGFSTITSNFNATIENKGLEVLMSTTNVSAGHFEWLTSVNMSFPSNMLVEFPGIEDSPYASQYKVGASLAIQRLLTWKGLDPQTGSHQFNDLNEDGMIGADDRSFMKPLDRKYYGGVSNTLRYKSLELSFLIQFSRQNTERYLSYNIPGFRGNQPVSILDRWQAEGDITDVQKFSQDFTASVNYSYLWASDYRIVDGTFARLKTVSLAYTVPSQVISRIRLQEAQFFIQGQNILTFADFDNFDPETGSSLPALRMVTMGVQFKL